MKTLNKLRRNYLWDRKLKAVFEIRNSKAEKQPFWLIPPNYYLPHKPDTWKPSLSFPFCSSTLINALPPWTRIQKDRSPPPCKDISHSLFRARNILPHKHARRFWKHEIDLLERLVFGFWHEEDLVEPADDGDAAVETEG